MAVEQFFTPSVIIRNITSGNNSKNVTILSVDIKPGQTVDLYRAMNVPVELFEFQIIKALEKPHGDLYVEQELKGSIEIELLNLISSNYSNVTPENIDSTNAYFAGAQLDFFSSDKFSWVDPVTVSHPLEITGNNVVSIPPAGGSSDGYLTKEDWARFNASVKGAIRIWQYQDFSAPVSSSVTLSAFENGSGVAFNASYIIDDTAVVVLTSNTSQPPTTTLTFPAIILPGSRVTVSSHTGTTVVFNSSPESTLNVRVFYLISLPATVALPNDYQEDPEFLNDSSLDYLDDLYVNQNQDESVYGDKTIAGHTVFNPVISTDPSFTITPDTVAPTTKVSDGSVTYVAGIQYNYDGTRVKWLSNERKFLIAGRAANNVTNAYIEIDSGVVSSDTGYRLLRNGTLTGIWAQTRDVETWTLEIRRNGVVTPIATLVITASRGNTNNALNIDVAQNDEIQFYVNGTAIARPVVGIEVAWRI